MRWALSLELPGLSLPQHEPVVRAAEAAGYTDAWSGETGGHDGFTSLLLAAVPVGEAPSPERYVELVESLAP